MTQTVKRGFFRIALDALIEARSREAQRAVDAYQASHRPTRNLSGY